MYPSYDDLYKQIKTVLDKNIDAQKRYLKAAEIAKHVDVKLFFKQKEHNRSLFNERLLFELNYAFNAPKIDGSFDNLDTNALENLDHLLKATDKYLLMESLKDDKIALQDYEALLKHDKLPLSIRFIMKEQMTVIILDELKMKQLIAFCK